MFWLQKSDYCLVNPKAIVTTQPTNKSVIYGNSTSFTVIATNVTAYQWQVSTGSGYTNVQITALLLMLQQQL
jgi:hypothetical protein